MSDEKPKRKRKLGTSSLWDRVFPPHYFEFETTLTPKEYMEPLRATWLQQQQVINDSGFAYVKIDETVIDRDTYKFHLRYFGSDNNRSSPLPGVGATGYLIRLDENKTRITGKIAGSGFLTCFMIMLCLALPVLLINFAVSAAREGHPINFLLCCVTPCAIPFMLLAAMSFEQKHGHYELHKLLKDSRY